MNLVATILLIALSVLSMWQNDQKTERSYTITLEETGCTSTRRMSCSYHFIEVSDEKSGKDKRHFNLLFYIGADQSEEREDAISRLAQFFRIKEESSFSQGAGNTGRVGYKKPVTLRILGSKYEFIREDGEKIVVDAEKKTSP